MLCDTFITKKKRKTPVGQSIVKNQNNLEFKDNLFCFECLNIFDE